MESAEARLKRMAMRSWRRGTKEMDLVLGPFADAKLADLAVTDLDLFDRILAQNDQDLLPMVLGQIPAPTDLQPLIDRIAVFAKDRLRG